VVRRSACLIIFGCTLLIVVGRGVQRRQKCHAYLPRELLLYTFDSPAILHALKERYGLIWVVSNLDQTHIQELSRVYVTQRPTAPDARQP
jgi:hypothetical protein